MGTRLERTARQTFLKTKNSPTIVLLWAFDLPNRRTTRRCGAPPTPTAALTRMTAVRNAKAAGAALPPQQTTRPARLAFQRANAGSVPLRCLPIVSRVSRCASPIQPETPTRKRIVCDHVHVHAHAHGNGLGTGRFAAPCAVFFFFCCGRAGPTSVESHPPFGITRRATPSGLPKRPHGAHGRKRLQVRENSWLGRSR